ncbi:MAG TPA: DUF4402 domain-containing protein [Gemmatimonadales bacterium]|nr:DUF4402 domain-containing protein [Gemmatimonadales bacterium]
MLRCFRVFPLLVLCLVARPLAGQSTVTPIQDLNFGVVIRGVTTTVDPTDPVKRGRFYVKHILNHQVGLRFALPSRLDRVGGGATMPINFGARDLMIQGTASNAPPEFSNPHGNQNYSLDTTPDIYVNLGGQVSPATNQPTGVYLGTITLTCVFF